MLLEACGGEADHGEHVAVLVEVSVGEVEAADIGAFFEDPSAARVTNLKFAWRRGQVVVATKSLTGRWLE